MPESQQEQEKRKKKREKINKFLRGLSVIAFFTALGGIALSIYVEVEFPEQEKVKYIALVSGILLGLVAIFTETFRNTYEATIIADEISNNSAAAFIGIQREIEAIKSDIAHTNNNYIFKIESLTQDVRSSTEAYHQAILKINNEVCTKFGEMRREYKVFPLLKDIIPMHFNNLGDLCAIGEEKYSHSPACQHLFNQYLPFLFNNFIDTDLAEGNSNLKSYKLKTTRAQIKLIFHFFNIAWGTVKSDGFIKATSIVPHKFWENSHDYLISQKKLLDVKKGASISRYFLFTKDSFDEIQHFDRAFTLNHEHGIQVRVTLLVNEEDIFKNYHDIGLIDTSVAIENKVDERGEIEESCTYINHDHADTKSHIERISGIFTNIENHRNTIKLEDSQHNVVAFQALIKKRIDELAGLKK